MHEVRMSTRPHRRTRTRLYSHDLVAGQSRSGETDTDTLDGRETDNWEHGYYYCPTCQENFDHLVEVREEAETDPQQER
jgi:hypothetical protein